MLESGSWRSKRKKEKGKKENDVCVFFICVHQVLDDSFVFNGVKWYRNLFDVCLSMNNPQTWRPIPFYAGWGVIHFANPF